MNESMIMKKILIPILGLATVLLAGCVVTSVYPFYTAKEVVFDPALLGVWSDAAKTNGDKETWTFEKIDGQTYKLIVHEKDKHAEYDMHLFKLKERAFLDGLPRERCDYTTPSHVLLRVDSNQPTLRMRPLNYDWLRKLVEADAKAIRHVVVPKAAGSSNDDDGL